MMQTSSSTTALHVCAFAYKFTGKERDSESGLDYFGARYYGSSMGRFMSPDWSKTPEGVPYADLSNPQTLNLYAYVVNNPLSRADADGHCANGFNWLCNFGQRIRNAFERYGFHTDEQVNQIVSEEQRSLRQGATVQQLSRNLAGWAHIRPQRQKHMATTPLG